MKSFFIGRRLSRRKIANSTRKRIHRLSSPEGRLAKAPVELLPAERPRGGQQPPDRWGPSRNPSECSRLAFSHGFPGDFGEFLAVHGRQGGVELDNDVQRTGFQGLPPVGNELHVAVPGI